MLQRQSTTLATRNVSLAPNGRSQQRFKRSKIPNNDKRRDKLKSSLNSLSSPVCCQARKDFHFHSRRQVLQVPPERLRQFQGCLRINSSGPVIVFDIRFRG